jgi:hypothetical protein
MVDHACSPNYSEGGDQENWASRPARQKASKTPSQLTSPSMVAHACDPNHEGGIGRIVVYDYPWAKNARPYLKTNSSKKGCWCGSSGRAPEFKKTKSSEYTE